VKKYWYLFAVQFCPVCGRQTHYKERQYSKKPKDINKRYIMREVWDGCGY